MDVDNSCVDTFSCECFCRLESHGNHKTCCDNCYVLTVTEGDTTTKLELIIGVFVNYGYCISAETEIEGAVCLHSRFNCRSCFNCVGGVYDSHAGDSSHKSNIFKALVCCAVLTNCDTCVCCANLNVQVGITNAVSNLLECSACRKHSKGGCKRHLTCRRKTCRNRYHVTFSDTAVEKSVGACLLEGNCLCSFCQVGVEHNVVVFICKFNESLTVALSCSYLICHFLCPPN